MSTFVSYYKEQDACGKEYYLYLTDNDVFNTKRGEELQKYGCSSDFSGHGAISFYYDLTKSYIHHEISDFSTPDNFPSEIAKAIKEGKMKRISESAPYRCLLELLNSKGKDRLKQLRSKETKKYNSEREPITPKQFLERAKFNKCVSKEEKLEITEKLERIAKSYGDEKMYFCGGCSSVIRYFNWDSTDEVNNYWQSIADRKLLVEDAIPRAISHKIIWKLFDKKKYKNPLWI